MDCYFGGELAESVPIKNTQTLGWGFWRENTLLIENLCMCEK
jgi:hypothetical protein